MNPGTYVAGVVLVGLLIYGVVQRRRNGPPESNPALIKMRRICGLVAIWCSVGAEIIALISIFTWGSPWWAGVVPFVLGALSVVLYRSVSKDTPQ